MMVKERYLWGGAIISLIAVAVTVGLVLESHDAHGKADEKVFSVGETDFLMDGEKFQYVAGSFHYFRAFRETWEDKLKVMKSTGLTVIDTYVEWATHNPEQGVYDWTGFADIEYFLELCQELDLYVILRPGPYICAERDNGGLPYWLFSKYPGIQVRTSDQNYLNEVEIWYEALFQKVERFLYGRGGNIIMVQVENEYGVFEACDKNYMEWLRDETKKHVSDDALLFTVDIPNERFECGIVEDVFITTDFGIDRDIDECFEYVRKHQTTGPLVNSEYYPGWLTHWQEENQRRDGDLVANHLDEMLSRGASVNFYMFFGGTNFGFTAGANDWGTGTYMGDITSYDYDAPMDEAGDATTKLVKIRNVILKHFPDMVISPVPDAKPKKAYGSLTLTPISNLFSETSIKHLVSKTINSVNPMSFEDFNQFSGFLLYETDLPDFEIDPTILTINQLADRALVYVDDFYVGTASRENAIYSIPINAGMGSKLKILVENQGRINFNKLDDIKGILGNVTINLFETGAVRELTSWKISGYPLTSETQINNFIGEASTGSPLTINNNGKLVDGPIFFYGTLELTADDLFDTYLDPTGFSKGVLYVNGFNLGRYWPVVGPQITMYVPKEILRAGTNEIVLLELQKAPVPTTVTFLDHSLLDKPRPTYKK